MRYHALFTLLRRNIKYCILCYILSVKVFRIHFRVSSELECKVDFQIQKHNSYRKMQVDIQGYIPTNLPGVSFFIYIPDFRTFLTKIGSENEVKKTLLHLSGPNFSLFLR